MRKFLLFAVLCVALCLPGLVADADAGLVVYINSYDSNVYPGDIWDSNIRVYCSG
jgi:hypothetical protein